MKNTAAHAVYHWAVPTQKSFKGFFILPGDEGLQQLPIGHSCRILHQNRLAKMPDDRVHGTGRHQLPSLAGTNETLPSISCSRLTLYTFFCGLARLTSQVMSWLA